MHSGGRKSGKAHRHLPPRIHNPDAPPGSFLPPSQSHSQHRPPLLITPRNYFSLTESNQWQASERWWTEPSPAAGCPTRSRRASERGHGCSLLQALRLLVASPLQIADARYAPTAHCHRWLPLPRILRVFFNLLSSCSRRARPSPDFPLGAGGVGPAFGGLLLFVAGCVILCFRLARHLRRPRRSRWNCGSDPIRSICSHAQERSESWFALAGGGRHFASLTPHASPPLRRAMRS